MTETSLYLLSAFAFLYSSFCALTILEVRFSATICSLNSFLYKTLVEDDLGINNLKYGDFIGRKMRIIKYDDWYTENNGLYSAPDDKDTNIIRHQTSTYFLHINFVSFVHIQIKWIQFRINISAIACIKSGYSCYINQ